MGKGDWKELPVSRANVVALPPCSAAQPADHARSAAQPADSRQGLPLDNAVQPAADDSSDAEDSEFEWEIVDDELAV